MKELLSLRREEETKTPKELNEINMEIIIL